MKKKSSKRKHSSQNTEAPLKREFANDPLVPGRSSLKRKIRRFYRNNKLVFYTLLGIACVFFISVGLVINELLISTEGDSVEQNEELVFDSSLGYEAFLNQVMEKRFGKHGMDAFQSIRVTGEMQLAGIQREFYLIKKRVALALLKIHLTEDASMTIGVNDSEVWRRLEKGGKDPLVQDVTGAEAEGFRAMGQFYTPFMHLVAYRDSKVFNVSRSDDLGVESIKVEFQNKLKGCRSIVYLDPIKLIELERIDYFEDDHQESVKFLNYQTFEGYSLPMKTEYYRDGVQIQQIVLTEVTLNPGVFKSLFERPKSSE